MSRITIALICICAGTAFGATINVPADYPSIGDAVAASAAGDEIVVQSGTYFESGILVEHPLAIRSAAADEQVVIDAGGADVCIVVDDPEGLVDFTDVAFINGQDGFYFESGDGVAIRFDRCEFSGNQRYGCNGSGTHFSPELEFDECRFVDNGDSGLLAVHSAGTLINDSVIEGNGGSGAFIVSGDHEWNRVEIRDNSADGYQEAGGGAVLVGCDAVLREVGFYNNTSATMGGGIAIGATGTYLLDECVFEGCDAPTDAQASISYQDGFTVTAQFNCCEIDTSQFGGSAWEAGMVEITHDGCTVPTATRSWSDVREMYR